MASVELVKRLGALQETIRQGQDNGTETLGAVKYQVDLLETWILENYGNTQTGCQNESKHERIPEEDSQQQWRVCSCSRMACMTCEAERQATVSATRWFDSQKPHTQLDVNAKREQDHWNRISHYVSQHLSSWFAPCIVDDTYHTTHNTLKYLVMLHPHLSATGRTENPKNTNACGLIALVFAKIILQAPPEEKIVQLLVTDPVCVRLTACGHDAVTNAIKDGNDLYDANCEGKADLKLDPNFTVLINSHMGVSLAEQMIIDPNDVMATLASAILQLKEGHILLFFRMEDYKVLSVINYHNEMVVIFDGQLHKMLDNDTDEEIEYGGVLCQMVKVNYAIMESLTLLEQHCGKFKGVCQLAIVKVDT